MCIRDRLYHWRTHQGSTALNPESKMYAYDAGARAIGAHYARVLPEIQIERIENGYTLGMYHTVFKFNEYPLISVIDVYKRQIWKMQMAINKDELHGF